MGRKLIYIQLFLIFTILGYSGNLKTNVFSQEVKEGKAVVNIDGKIFNMKAKFTMLSVVILKGGSFKDRDFTTLTIGIPADFGPGEYNNDRDNYVKGKYMMISGNRVGDGFRYDPENVFKVNVKSDKDDYIFT